MEDSSGNDFQFPSTQYSGNDNMLLGRKIVMEDSGSQLVLYIITGWLIGWKKKSDIDSGINQEPAVLKVTFGSISSCIWPNHHDCYLGAFVILFNKQCLYIGCVDQPLSLQWIQYVPPPPSRLLVHRSTCDTKRETWNQFSCLVPFTVFLFFF